MTKDRVLVGEVARLALCIETPRIGTADQRRITAIMERLGWMRLKPGWQGQALVGTAVAMTIERPALRK